MDKTPMTRAEVDASANLAEACARAVGPIVEQYEDQNECRTHFVVLCVTYKEGKGFTSSVSSSLTDKEEILDTVERFLIDRNNEATTSEIRVVDVKKSGN
jgi:protein involved in ribonucleotide reduction